MKSASKTDPSHQIRIVPSDSAEFEVEVHYAPLDLVSRNNSYAESRALALGLKIGLTSCGVDVTISDEIREDHIEFDEEAE